MPYLTSIRKFTHTH